MRTTYFLVAKPITEVCNQPSFSTFRIVGTGKDGAVVGVVAAAAAAAAEAVVGVGGLFSVELIKLK